ncbi:helix-turn-helix transcriptional regulator [Anabaena sp. FACHB-709]|uniref:Transcriptional regulator n=2 Tax=Nostocaceae TaxID=1162 RepID=A0A1Z4KGW5_ANAVA|nr:MULTISPECIES: helix-turn-helix domain-containing protein [Nostocaceae]BAY68212.1 transcriptional regulator [Trichormus variabilis NIES-23]HBW29950.1 AraC family transcriptional regulator [Nostoc sp. UBA8866]MBD2169706.1 helix-turn-helix transcriptional regulator [Anabaena cylindrica FACHB-318]MBD2261875.1 helix-turn-helix transcriptional regulator [Anabaena sp. FACHB-709]MBD2271460.1 helix-turn-helix transcriptional regulator [Nostoc sp. PCC 7120 = FACHB-418]
MVLILQESADCYQPLTENNNTPQSTIWEAHIHDPQGMSHGYRQWFHLRPGISLLTDCYQLNDDLVVEKAPSPALIWLELSFNIFGHNICEGVYPGENFLDVYRGLEPANHTEWQAQEKVLKFDIHLEYSELQRLFAHQMDLLPASFRRMFEKNDDEPEYRNFGITTHEMQIVLRQILNCPYQGLTKQLYLEGKILELLALRLEYLQENPTNINTDNTLKNHQVDGIYHARDILIKNLNNPPSLIDLARLVGLNDCTLKKGFQEVFGTTAFGYLHEYRMEQAKELLLEKEMNVTQVAQVVGYEARTSFIRAFRKKFGVSPTAYIQRNSA